MSAVEVDGWRRWYEIPWETNLWGLFVWRMICCGAICAGDAKTLDSERKLKYEELFFIQRIILT